MTDLEDEVRAYYERELLIDPFGNEDESGPELPPPGELQLLWQIENFKALPWEGGLMDQPALLMDLINICRNIRAEVEHVAAAQTAGPRFDASKILRGQPG